jgi:hypothetical protein
VSSSGLIYAVIVGAWAAYLVPMWLRRQDELNEARPTERFSTAIRLLSGRAAMERKYAKTRDEDDDEQPAAEKQPDQLDVKPEEPVDVRSLAVPATQAKSPPSSPSPSPAQAQRKAKVPTPRAKVLARRRRTTTLLFLAFTAGAIVAAVGGLALLWAPAVPAVLLTLYIGHLRSQERRRFEVKLDQRRAADAAQRLRDRPAHPEPAPEPIPVPEQPAAADRRALVEQTDHAEWVDQQRAPSEDTWEVPAPRPTFATAPVTRPRPRDRAPRGTPLFDQYSNPDRPRAANE